MTKKCSTCKIEKPLSEFYPIANGLKGVRPRCKECAKTVLRKKYKENAEYRIDKLDKQYDRLKNDPDARKDHMTRCRRWHLKKSYGLSLDDFQRLLESQGGGCAICGNKPEHDVPKTRMVVDHCHATNKVRGILCDLCNTAIGKFQDDPDLLRSAIKYLEYARAPD